MIRPLLRRSLIGAFALAVTVNVTSCGWRGVNSLPLPGTQGHGPGAYVVRAQLTDVTNIQENSRVRVGDVPVGNVTRIERQGWHAVVTMKLNGDVVLPANATATVGQTSLLGSMHIELAPPTNAVPQGRLHDGSLITLGNGAAYPTTERTLAAVSLLLNGGGIGRIQDITQAFSTAFAGRAGDLRSFIQRFDTFITRLNAQKDDILAATDSLNNLAAQFAEQKPVVDKALRTIPDALELLDNLHEHFADATIELGKFLSVAGNIADRSKHALSTDLNDLAPVLESLANAGPALTRSLAMLSTFPWPKDTLLNWFRGDYANLTGIFDLTLSRLDTGFLTGTRWEGNMTRLELQWGRTIGQLPSPATAGNPLVIPYHFDQGK
jgi:phospholipid/cholesterol/gamma-HCH transport system substrate-binding protein